MNNTKKVPTGRMEFSLERKLERLKKLSLEIDWLEEQIAYAACPFDFGQAIEFYRNGRKMHGHVYFIHYEALGLWRCSVVVKGRVNRVTVHPRDLRP